MPPDTAKEAPRSAFDSQHAPQTEILDKCVHCGFCLPVCPTYVLWGQEMDSPRGRIYLMRMASEGVAQLNGTWVRHIDLCLGCVACMTACPSGVDYGKLIEATRSQVERHYDRSFWDRLHRKVLFDLFTSPRSLAWLRGALRIYQASGLQRLVRKAGLLRLFPRSVGEMEALLPRLAPIEPIQEVTEARGEKQKRVGFLLGCVQRAFLPEVNAATVRVLTAEGFEVVSPAGPRCCGALLVHGGEEARAQAFARELIDIFERANVEFIVTNAAGCGSTLKEYGHLLRDDPAYAERARRFAARCRDVSEVLAEIPPRCERKPLVARVAFHDSCHLQHAQGIRAQPRSLLAQIPGLELTELAESPVCCGSAGIYNLVQPETAKALGDRKASLIAPLRVAAAVTGNPGCMLQLAAALRRAGSPTRVLHSIQLLDASLRGVKIDSLP